MVLVALRPFDPASANASLSGSPAEAPIILRPALLSQCAVSALLGATVCGRSSEEPCEAGGKPAAVTAGFAASVGPRPPSAAHLAMLLILIAAPFSP